jgi:hypothetical protein
MIRFAYLVIKVEVTHSTFSFVPRIIWPHKNIAKKCIENIDAYYKYQFAYKLYIKSD